jgi:type III secretory pathway lipoprotein EscJ
MIIAHRVTASDRASVTTCAGGELANRDHGMAMVVGLRSGLVCLLLVLLFLMTGCQGATSLATVQTEDEAIEILNVLHENGIEARKEEAGEEGVKQWRILLEQSWLAGSAEVAMANQVLQDNGLPRPSNTGQQANSESGVFKDESTRKAEQLKQREDALQKKLRLLPGVIGVEVSIVEPEDSAININPYPSTASVLIVTKDDPPNFEAETVKGLVARSVPKLTPESVFVAITTKPVRPVPLREFGLQKRHKSLDAIGIGIMIILASSVVVLLLQMKRQNNELLELRSAAPDANRQDQEDLDQNRVGDHSSTSGRSNQQIMPVEQTINPSALDSAAKRVIEGNEI